MNDFHEFIDAVGYSNNKDNLFQVDLGGRKINDRGTVLLLPPNEHHIKTVLECLLRLFSRCASGLRPPNPYGKSETGMSAEMIMNLQILGRAVGYFINSTSWEKQEIKSFDVDEFKKRFERLSEHLSKIHK